MNIPHIRSTLQQALPRNEADIYIALLRLGLATVSMLAKETGMHRTNIYDILEKLKEKGLVGVVMQKNVKYYDATSPEKLLDYLDERKESIGEIIPELINLTKLPKQAAVVEVLKGIEGVKTALSYVPRECKDIVWFGAITRLEETPSPVFWKQLVRKCDNAGISERGILLRGESVLPLKKHEYRYLPKRHIFSTSFVQFGDMVALFIWSHPVYVILIKDKDIAETYLKYFEFMWRHAKK